MKVKVQQMSKRTMQSLRDYNNELYEEVRDLRRKLMHTEEDRDRCIKEYESAQRLYADTKNAEFCLGDRVTELEKDNDGLRQENEHLSASVEQLTTLMLDARRAYAEEVDHSNALELEIMDREEHIHILEMRIDFLEHNNP